MTRFGWVGLLALAGCTAVGTAKAGLGTFGAVAGASGLTVEGQLQITVDAWSRFSTDTGGLMLRSKGARDVPGLITQVFERGLPPGAPVDLVFVVDTTGSMGDDIDAVKADMRRILRELTLRNPDRRVGVVAYRDKRDVYVSKTVLAMTTDEAAILDGISALQVGGGGDLREHVYAGVDTALTEQTWRPGASQHVILMGDAPPHDDYRDDPRTYASVIASATTAPRAVRIHSIGITCDLLCQGLIGVGL